MEIYERIRLLRKEYLRLSQEKFGAILGVNRDVIKNIELNLLARPEQKEPLIKLISKEFNVNYEWLINGEGEMFTETAESLVKRLSTEYGLGFYVEKIIECYLNLDNGQRDAVEGLIKSIAEAWQASPDNISVLVDEAIDNATKTKHNPKDELTLEAEADEFAAMAREQFLQEKRLERQTSSAKEPGAG